MIRPLIFLLAVLWSAAIAWPAHAVTVEKVTSPGGVTAWLVQDHSNPLLAMEVAFAGGSAVETKSGLANMMASLLDEGAGSLGSQQFQGRLEDLSIELGFRAGKDEVVGSLKTLAENHEAAFDLFRLALTQPRFDKEAVGRIRAQILAGLSREQQNPNAVAARAWNRAMFGEHPYGRATSGEPDSVKSITAADLRDHARTWISRQDLLIGVVGDITPERLAPLLDRAFGALPATHPPVRIAEATLASGRTLVVARDIPQSVALFGVPGLHRNDPDWFPAFVMNYILGGGGFSSRLTEEVREKRGLAYSVYTHLVPLDHAALIAGGVATRNARVGQSLDLIRQELRRLAADGPTGQELADAKTYLTGSFPLSLDSIGAIASLLVSMQSDHLPMDYLDHRSDLINAVTRDQVTAVARRLLDPDRLVVVVVGQPEGVATRTP